MAQKKQKPLTYAEKQSLAQAAKQAERLKDIATLVDSNLATKPNESWRTLTVEHKEVILYRVRAGDTVSHVCKELGISPGLVYSAAHFDVEFGGLMAEARIIGSYALADALREVHQEEGLSDARVKIKSDNYKWLLARQNRQEYGDKIDVRTTIIPDPVMLPLEGIIHHDDDGEESEGF